MIKLIKLIVQPLAYSVLVVVFLFAALPAAIIALPFPRRIRTRISAPMWQIFSFFAVYIVTFSKVYRRDERTPEEKKGYPRGLYICNHQSFMDIPLVILSVPIPPIMKKEVLYIPVLGICGYSAGAMIVDRKDPDSRKKVFRQAQERLTTGLKTLMFYPEGTRQKASDHPKTYDEIKKPILKFAFENNIPVHCVSVYGTKKVMKSHSVLVNFGQKVGIIVSEAQKPSEFGDSEAFMRHCWQKVTDGYFELQEKLT